MLTDPAGRPVAIRVFAGNTADPTAFSAAVSAVKDSFALANMVMVGDRGMITSARITALKDLGGIGWLTALRAPSIAALAADDGPLQMSLFDDQDFAEITHPDYPDERLICCRNPLLAADAPANAANYSPPQTTPGPNHRRRSRRATGRRRSDRPQSAVDRAEADEAVT